MRQNLKLLSVAILCFFGGMQFDSGSVVQVNFSSHDASHEINAAPPSSSSAHISSSSSSVGNPRTDTDAPPLFPQAVVAQSKSSQAVVARSAEITTGTKKQPQSTQPPEVGVVQEKKQSAVKTTANSTPIERIVLLGERHSGTNWITDHLDECFGDRVIVSSSIHLHKKLALIYI
jgi:hypothetical protein